MSNLSKRIFRHKFISSLGWLIVALALLLWVVLSQGKLPLVVIDSLPNVVW
jgi:hypothetical protein